jgi:hypothetical protein
MVHITSLNILGLFGKLLRRRGVHQLGFMAFGLVV